MGSVQVDNTVGDNTREYNRNNMDEVSTGEGFSLGKSRLLLPGEDSEDPDFYS